MLRLDGWKKGFNGARTGGRGFTLSNIVHMVVRFLQIIMACVVIGYYGFDLHAAHKVNKYSDSKWVFAIAVGSMSAISALIYLIVCLFSQWRTVSILFAWEWILFILWAAVTGLFGGMYFHENAEMDKGVQDMKTAAAFDVVNLILWFLTAAVSTFGFFVSGRKSLHTGRANL